MEKRRAAALVAAGLLAVVSIWWLARDRTSPHWTGFVEGEERVLRSEVMGRILEVPHSEGALVPPNAPVARLDDADIQSQIVSARREVAVLDAQIRGQQERIVLTETTWERDVRARAAELRQAEAAARLAERTLARERGLVATGASTAQLLDDRRANRDEADSGRERARALLARTEAEGRSVELARQELATLRERQALARARLDELAVTAAKYVIRSPAVETVVQTQFAWPGELAQPGTALVAVLDPTDKYVQVYVPVADIEAFRVGRRVEIALDSRPDERVPGEVVFVADRANFTPEKVETRSDRLGQVYRAKVRILEGVERLQPGTEGDVYLVEDGATG